MEPHEVLYEDPQDNLYDYLRGCPRECPACGVSARHDLKTKKPTTVKCPNCDHEFTVQKYRRKNVKHKQKGE